MPPTAAEHRALGRYGLHGEIVSGGMGVVHFACRNDGASPRRVVAIKRLHPALVAEPEFGEDFLREASLAMRIHHPNVVATLEVGADANDLFVAMEYLHGESLARLQDAARARGIPTPPPVAARIAVDMLHGLHAVHTACDEDRRPMGVVHRDVSPHNLLVGEDGVSRVIDFGIAKVAGAASNTRPGHVKGRLSYMAPEQLKRSPVTASADIFAAAVVLWESLANLRLFASGSVGTVMRRILEGRIEPPSTHAIGIPPSLDEVVMRGLRPDPAERFVSALAFADAIEQVLPLASREEVAAWVRGLASDVLEARSRIVSSLERNEAEKAPAVLAPIARPGHLRRPHSGRWIVVVALGAVLAAVALGWGVARYWDPQEHMVAIPSTSGAVVGHVAGSRVPPASAVAPSSTFRLPDAP